MDQPYDDDPPSIIARGIWETDEEGVTTYHPSHHRPPRDEDDALPAGDHVCQERLTRPLGEGYRPRSRAVWDQARDDYLAGHTAEAVCARYDLRPGTFRHRARAEGWRRSDQADPAPLDWEAEADDLAAAALPDYAAMARAALVRADRAIRAGRDLEAARWLRMHERLSRLITDYSWRLNAWREAEDAEAEAAPPPETNPEPAPAPDPVAEPEIARLDLGDQPEILVDQVAARIAQRRSPPAGREGLARRPAGHQEDFAVEAAAPAQRRAGQGCGIALDQVQPRAIGPDGAAEDGIDLIGQGRLQPCGLEPQIQAHRAGEERPDLAIRPPFPCRTPHLKPL